LQEYLQKLHFAAGPFFLRQEFFTAADAGLDKPAQRVYA
jgi:hypothetical protein